LNALARKVDGTQSTAATVANRKRAVLFNALEYAIELKILTKNPIPGLKWKAPKVDHEVDPRAAVNPVQARTLLREVVGIKRSGPHLAACYACSYYSGLRPEEAINLRKANITLPPQIWNDDTKQWEDADDAWGEFHLEKAAPHAAGRIPAPSGISVD
jgi:integrase